MVARLSPLPAAPGENLCAFEEKDSLALSLLSRRKIPLYKSSAIPLNVTETTHLDLQKTFTPFPRLDEIIVCSCRLIHPDGPSSSNRARGGASAAPLIPPRKRRGGLSSITGR
jgi:hypothetical protein